jgi:hypothetical protein
VKFQLQWERNKKKCIYMHPRKLLCADMLGETLLRMAFVFVDRRDFFC